MATRRGRRGVGAAAALQRKRPNIYEAKGAELESETLSTAIETVSNLERELLSFTKKHSKKIQTDATFRAEFLKMCGPLGIDPLVSSQKGLFGGLLGIGQFYNELSIKVAEVCMASRTRNGGIISVSEVKAILSKRGTKFNFNTDKTGNNVSSTNCSEDDIARAVGKLAKLGSGFRLKEVGKSMMIISVPMELSQDHMEVMEIASTCEGSFGSLTVDDVIRATKWDRSRITRAMDLLLEEGMAWIDVSNSGQRYWFPSLWKEALTLVEGKV